MVVPIVTLSPVPATAIFNPLMLCYLLSYKNSANLLRPSLIISKVSPNLTSAEPFSMQSSRFNVSLYLFRLNTKKTSKRCKVCNGCNQFLTRLSCKCNESRKSFSARYNLIFRIFMNSFICFL